MNNHNLIIFRNDLRIKDNSALHFACKNQLDKVSAIFIATPKQWLKHNDSPKKIVFLYQHLKNLQNKLYDLGIHLYVYQKQYFIDSIHFLLQFSLKNKVNHVFYNYQYEINEKNRDKMMEKILLNNNILINGFHDGCLVHPKTIKNKLKMTYKLFFPFYKKIIQKLKYDTPVCYPTPKKRVLNYIFPKKPIYYFDFPYETINTDIFPIGEENAFNHLKYFFKNHLKKYFYKKDLLFRKNTSLISAYLNIGVISSRQCLNILLKNSPNIINSHHKNDWIVQLLWKEFYQHLFEGYSLLSKNRSFHNLESKIPWNNNQKNLHLWKIGATGYPIIDAGMKQLNEIGWISNRMRMITASFLVKNLLIDWKEGEKYFMSRLIDGNLASNNSGWQWISSIGINSIPYFRMFNPIEQSKKFDPSGIYIRHYLPELNKVPEKYIHEPHIWMKTTNFKLNYPHPIVEHKQSRTHVLRIFSKISKKLFL